MDCRSETTKRVLELHIEDYRLQKNSVTIAGFPWCLKNEQPTNEDNKDVYKQSLTCNPESRSPLWSCKALITVRAIVTGPVEIEKGNMHSVEHVFQLNNKKYTVSLGDLLSDDELDLKNSSANLILRWEIEILSVVGIRPLEKKLDFRVKNDDDDRAIIVDGSVLYVNKGILSLSSPYFKALFNSVTTQEENIVIEDVDVEDFICLLHYIYPCSEEITEKNIDAMLKISDKFDIPCVIAACERVLISNATNRGNNATIPFIKLLQCADEYHLAAVQDRCIKRIRCFCQIKALTEQRDYRLLKLETKVAIFEQALGYIEECEKSCIQLEQMDMNKWNDERGRRSNDVRNAIRDGYGNPHRRDERGGGFREEQRSPQEFGGGQRNRRRFGEARDPWAIGEDPRNPRDFGERWDDRERGNFGFARPRWDDRGNENGRFAAPDEPYDSD